MPYVEENRSKLKNPLVFGFKFGPALSRDVPKRSGVLGA